MQDAQQIAKQIFQFEMFDMFGEDEIILVLQAADDLYFNDDEESFLTDPQYDALRLYASQTFPTNDYFLGVGAAVRGEMIDLPYTMGSLDQVQIGGIKDWNRKWGLDVEEILISDKLDGASALVIYDNRGRLKIAYSRGDGLQGQDITRHITHLVPPRVSGPMAIRAEAIISKSNFIKAKTVAKTRAGNEYKNARNMVSGLLNASKNPAAVYQYIHFVAYEIVDVPDNEKTDKRGMLERLHNEGFRVPYYKIVKGGELNDDFLAMYLERRRDETEYEIDGLVLDANDLDVRDRMNPTRDTLNPAYSIKYKVADADNLAETTCVAVHWAPSKHGYWKPRIEIDPVDLVGVTITFCTGFNAQFIVENNIGPGAVIEVTRSGDVIPFCQKVVKGTTASLPDDDYDWIGVDIRMKDYENHPEVQIQQMVDFFSSVEAPLLKEGSIRKLHEAGYTTIKSVIMLAKDEMVRIIGSNGTKIYEGLRNVLTNIPLYKVAGAYSMERGIGVRRMKALQLSMGRDNLLTCDEAALIAEQDGFDDITADATIRALRKFRTFIFEVAGYVTIAEEKDTSDGALSGKKVVFTGFRDRVLQGQIEDAGGIMQSSVSGKTNIVVTKDPNGTSSKLNKARDLGIEIVSVNEMRSMI